MSNNAWNVRNPLRIDSREIANVQPVDLKATNELRLS